MELPLKKAMYELRGAREVIPVTSRMSVSRHSEPEGSYVARDVQYRITYEAKFQFRIILPDDGEALQYGHAKAVHVMTEELYGPLRTELLEILHLMWEEGIYGPAEQKVRNILRIFT